MLLSLTGSDSRVLQYSYHTALIQKVLTIMRHDA